VVADRVVGEELVSEEVRARRRPGAFLRLTQPPTECDWLKGYSRHCALHGRRASHSNAQESLRVLCAGVLASWAVASGRPGIHERAAAQDAKRYCREVVRILKLLKQTRDMTINEVKLTLAIEDPSQREQREYLGVEARAPP
jgi:hypothetical protein